MNIYTAHRGDVFARHRPDMESGDLLLNIDFLKRAGMDTKCNARPDIERHDIRAPTLWPSTPTWTNLTHPQKEGATAALAEHLDGA